MAISDPLDGITVFAAVAEAESFTSAARTLGMSKAAVSIQVQKLEDRLGSRLLNRTTRRVSLTEEGRAYYAHARRILTEARDAVDSLDTLSSEPKGLIRINAPMSFGFLHLGKAIAEFMKTYRKVEIDLSLNDRKIDLVEEGFDLGIRIASLPDSSMIARRLAPCRRIVVGSPAYWNEHGRPKHPDDLRQHTLLSYGYLTDPDAWIFKGPAGDIRIPVKSRYRANNGDVLMQAAVEGVGVYMAPTFFFSEAINCGALESVLHDFEADPISIYAIYPHRRHLSARVRSFVDFLAARFGDNPYWDQACEGRHQIS